MLYKYTVLCRKIKHHLGWLLLVALALLRREMAGYTFVAKDREVVHGTHGRRDLTQTLSQICSHTRCAVARASRRTAIKHLPHRTARRSPASLPARSHTAGHLSLLPSPLMSAV